MYALSQTAIKICGITRLEDAIIAHSLGASMVGVIFDRCVIRHGSVEVATMIADAGIATVTVHTSEVKEVAGNESFVQLHYNHTPQHIEKIREKTGKGIISVVKAGDTDQTLEKVEELSTAHPDYILVEDKAGIARRKDLIMGLAGKRGIGFAGGITVSQLSELMRYKPAMIDASSSMEISAGIKSAEKMRAFIREAAAYADIYQN
ncbi:MAG: phosphoribosylanthranilate isomerase [Candidatus Thermoplasmatota archaeon]|nr:phosphoribosylanthranilate isomerase [Candidatus Thermoplasmatota archaeon]